MIRLAESLKPRDVSREPWFVEAKNRLEQIREEQRLNEEAQKDKADAPFREMIKEDLQKIKVQVDKGIKPFLKFVNEHYTPASKKIELTEEMLAFENLKKTITIKFTRVFHPDKNVNEPRQI